MEKSTAPSAEPSPEVMAAITAAINEAISKKVRISRIRYRRQPPGPAWQVLGQTTIMSSRGVHNR